MATDRDDTDFEPSHSSSPTDHVLTELQLYGHRPFQDEPDRRPLPEGNAIGGAVADIFDALITTLRDTRLEPDLEDLLWSAVNLFHRALTACNASSTTMRTRRSAARRNRTARRSARSNWNAAPKPRCCSPPDPRSLSPAASTSTIMPRSGTRSTKSTPSILTWCCCTAAVRRAQSASPPAGLTTAR